MKRTSPIYVRYLENLVIALLTERNSEDDIVGFGLAGEPTTYVPYNVRSVIADAQASHKDNTL